MIWLQISLVLLILLCSYFIYRAYVLAGLLADSEEYIKQVEDLSSYMYRTIDKSYQRMKQIDSKGSFESDDEAGSTFIMLKDVIENLQKEFNAQEEEKTK